jgi:uncharacterized membrane protein YfcA
VGWVLLYIGARIFYELAKRNKNDDASLERLEAKFKERVDRIRAARDQGIVPGLPSSATVKTGKIGFSSIEYEFYGGTFSFNPLILLALSAVVGVVGGVYGIGGGAIVAPILVAVFRLPVYTVAGAALVATFVSSIAGVIFYSLIAPAYAHTGLAIEPDWLLGALFGVGGLAGTYCGARAQKFVPAKIVKIILGLSITILALRYIIGFLVQS